jgi:glyoxylase I family protein
MKIEHVALLVADPVAMASWYTQNLDMRVVRSSDEAPAFTRFLADSEGQGVLELYSSATLPVPSYAEMDPLVLHIAFAPDNVPATRDRLVAAGATPVGEVTVNPAGDYFAMLRDPWGVALQLVRRTRPLVG